MIDLQNLAERPATVRLAATTLPALVRWLAETYPDRPAVTDGPVTLSFAAFRHEVMAFAKALHAEGVRRGDHVAVLMGNRKEWLVAHFAAQQLGATTVALNTWYTARELAYVLAHSEAAVLVMASQFLRNDYVAMLGSLQPWAETFPALRRIVVCHGPAGQGMVPVEQFLAAGAGIEDAMVEAAGQAVSPEEMALLLYTSGSTARPKGVRLLHRGLLDNCFDIGERQRLTERDVLLLPVSLFWGFGCSNALMAAWTHGTHIVLQEHFDAAEALRLIERHRCTALYGTFNIVGAIAEHPDRASHELGSLRTGLTFSTPDRMRWLIETMMPEVCQVYGFTEGYGNSTVTDVADPLDKRLATVGRVLPGSELRIVDPTTDEPVPTGEVGEIRVRGHIMPGYFKDPVQTTAAFDADGFFRTGDFGMLDEDGFLQFRGRLKELVKTGGMNVSPAEVEDVLLSHPEIAEAFVLGLADTVHDEVVAAVVVLKAGSQLLPKMVATHCQHRLAAYKRPREIRIVDRANLPLTTTGKLHRARLVELFAPLVG
jgi:fatty-acyl-CoA synthase